MGDRGRQWALWRRGKGTTLEPSQRSLDDPSGPESQDETHAELVLIPLKPSLAGVTDSQTARQPDLGPPSPTPSTKCSKRQRQRQRQQHPLRSAAAPDLTLTLSRLQSIRPALLVCRRLRTLHNWNTRERRGTLVAGHLNVEIWNRAERLQVRPPPFQNRRQDQIKEFEPHLASAHRESRSKSSLLEARLAHQALSRGVAHTEAATVQHSEQGRAHIWILTSLERRPTSRPSKLVEPKLYIGQIPNDKGPAENTQQD
ncbi:hypothetical protein NA56DRAFT_708536 [Hyaloscypha hepaticicola]|uniref:Uncharacterized protein n=1 Tax=Hyaloscypha hepaticicola TaxID=2082293 RepID=A0A2J6PRT3_9HELO|nr:hypothetical protein NA56DRAFT_708536 [Hyaloscypha hepaticicola]